MSHDTADQSMTLEQLRLAIVSITGLQANDIADDDNLLLLGVDSMGIMRLVNMWRKQGIRVSSRELLAEPTLVAWQQHIDALRAVAAAEQALPHPALRAVRRRLLLRPCGGIPGTQGPRVPGRSNRDLIASPACSQRPSGDGTRG